MTRIEPGSSGARCNCSTNCTMTHTLSLYDMFIVYLHFMKLLLISDVEAVDLVVTSLSPLSCQ